MLAQISGPPSTFPIFHPSLRLVPYLDPKLSKDLQRAYVLLQTLLPYQILIFHGILACHKRFLQMPRFNTWVSLRLPYSLDLCFSMADA